MQPTLGRFCWVWDVNSLRGVFANQTETDWDGEGRNNHFDLANFELLDPEWE